MKFIVTEELGRLAKWLRILGFDTVFFEKGERRELVLRSLKEDRVILSRDSKMSRFTGTRFLHIDTDFVEEQLKDVIKKLNLEVERSLLFSICVVCNEPLGKADRELVKGRVAPYVFETHKDFMLCKKCGRIYWRGTHWELVNNFLKRLNKLK
jgi:uncharacterized protein with PIN domain